MSDEKERVWLPDQEMGKRIRHLREEVLPRTLGVRKVTQEGLAQYLDSDQGTISQYERGERPFPDEKKVLLAKLANVAVTYFMVPELKEATESGSTADWSSGYEAALNRVQRIVEELRARPHPEPVSSLADHVARGIAMSARNDVDADERNGSQG